MITQTHRLTDTHTHTLTCVSSPLTISVCMKIQSQYHKLTCKYMYVVYVISKSLLHEGMLSIKTIVILSLYTESQHKTLHVKSSLIALPKKQFWLLPVQNSKIARPFNSGGC